MMRGHRKQIVEAQRMSHCRKVARRRAPRFQRSAPTDSNAYTSAVAPRAVRMAGASPNSASPMTIPEVSSGLELTQSSTLVMTTADSCGFVGSQRQRKGLNGGNHMECGLQLDGPRRRQEGCPVVGWCDASGVLLCDVEGGR